MPSVTPRQGRKLTCPHWVIFRIQTPLNQSQRGRRGVINAINIQFLEKNKWWPRFVFTHFSCVQGLAGGPIMALYKVTWLVSFDFEMGFHFLGQFDLHFLKFVFSWIMVWFELFFFICDLQICYWIKPLSYPFVFFVLFWFLHIFSKIVQY